LTTKLLVIVTRKLPGSNVPLTVRDRLLLIDERRVTVLPAFIVILRNKVTPLTDCVEPENVTVPPEGVNVPELTQFPVSDIVEPVWVMVPLLPITMFPETVTVLDTVRVEALTDVPMVSDLQVAVDVIDG
jgi:hypothetical protein